MSDETLFPIEPSHRPPSSADAAGGSPRLRTAQRDQIELRPCDLESLLPADHPARSIWAMVERMDLEGFGNCTNIGECRSACPKDISIQSIARMRQEYVRALVDR